MLNIKDMSKRQLEELKRQTIIEIGEMHGEGKSDKEIKIKRDMYYAIAAELNNRN